MPGGRPDGPVHAGTVSAGTVSTGHADPSDPSGHRGKHRALAPSDPGGVVLDIGDDVGALVLYGPAGIDGREIEISPGADPAAPRSHAEVRRRLPGLGELAAPAGQPAAGQAAAIYAAVYPGLPAGSYTIWRDADLPAGTVIVRGGRVASFWWD